MLLRNGMHSLVIEHGLKKNNIVLRRKKRYLFIVLKKTELNNSTCAHHKGKFHSRTCHEGPGGD
jgi:hypothetical protein